MTSCRESSAELTVRHLGLIDYVEAWDLQKQLVDERLDGGPDTLLLLEHPNVYTAGRRTQPEDRPVDGTPVIDVDRGGKITWHGPGQIVGYPLVKLSDPVDVVDFVRRLEEAMIWVCDQFGLRTGRIEGRSGVWLPAGEGRIERKIGAIGIRVQRGVTLHGISLNCDNSNDGFDAIIPCGLKDVGVTSLSTELGRDVTTAEVFPLIEQAILRAIDGELPVSHRDLPRPTVATPAGITLDLDSSLTR
ncbi:lipoyl(octanoyl) transferase LipB [Pseudonocardiaceae bacterium YIM PH 21723]|nr:lipoyl(octanoyl) transferase LipB [Pseudonocardiaceae bacterium YIM PH 21723]